MNLLRFILVLAGAIGALVRRPRSQILFIFRGFRFIWTLVVEDLTSLRFPVAAFGDRNFAPHSFVKRRFTSNINRIERLFCGRDVI